MESRLCIAFLVLQLVTPPGMTWFFSEYTHPAQDLSFMTMVNPSGAEARILRAKKVDINVTDALAPCVAGLPSAIVLTV